MFTLGDILSSFLASTTVDRANFNWLRGKDFAESEFWISTSICSKNLPLRSLFPSVWRQQHLSACEWPHWLQVGSCLITFWIKETTPSTDLGASSPKCRTSESDPRTVWLGNLANPFQSRINWRKSSFDAPRGEICAVHFSWPGSYCPDLFSLLGSSCSNSPSNPIFFPPRFI